MKVGKITIMTLIAMFAGELCASTFYKVSEEKLFDSADHIIMGEVTKIETVVDAGVPFQHITIKVENIYKTKESEALLEGDEIVIRQIGGEGNGKFIKLDGLPSFTEKSNVFVNLKKNNEGYFYVIGSNQGKYDVLNRREMIRDTTESMFVRQGENGKMIFTNGAVERRSLEEMVTKIRINTVQ